MSKTVKKALSLLLCAALLFGAAPLNGFGELRLPRFSALFGVQASAADFGSCGENMTWEYDPNTFTLTIGGTGAMEDYLNRNEWDLIHFTNAPWQDYTLSVQNVVIGKGITSIGDNAFSWFMALTSVTLPESLTRIGMGAFEDCEALASIRIPAAVTTIDSYAFSGCSALADITLSDGITKLGSGAFDFTAYVDDSGNWQNNVLYIGNYFLQANRKELAGSFEIRPDTKVIADYAFRDCVDLTSVKIPDSVVFIGDNAFSGCKNMTDLTVGAGVRGIGCWAFLNCLNLTDVTYRGTQQEWDAIDVGAYNDPLLNATLHYIEPSFFSGLCGDKMTWKYYPDTLKLTISGMGAMDDYSTGYLSLLGTEGKITTAPWRKYYKEIQTVEIQSGVTGIGNNAFNRCVNLTSVIIGGDVTAIGEDAFYATGLIDVTIPDRVETIGSYAFGKCKNLTNVSIGSGVAQIGDSAFPIGGVLNAITVDDDNAFFSSDAYGVLYNKEKTELILYPTGNTRTSFVVPDSVKKIDYYSFGDCSALKEVTIGSQVTEIENYAFACCRGLTSVNIADGVTRIGYSAFGLCNHLAEITLPDSLTSIGEYAFAGTAYRADEKNWQNGVFYIGHHLIEVMDPSITQYEIAPGTLCVADSAFRSCASLARLTVPASVVSIGKASFKDCAALTDVSYGGTQSEWDCISLGAANQPLLDATLHTKMLHEHEYVPAVTKSATCSEEGVLTYTCACGDSYTEAIPKSKHTPRSIVTVEPTCTKAGVQHDECEVCGERLTGDTELPARSHTYSAWFMMTDPTTTSDGKMGRKCTVCGVMLDEMTIPMLLGEHVTGVSLSDTNILLDRDERIHLTAAVTPAAALDKTVLWTSSSPHVATVDNGWVTAIAPGVTVIIAQTADCGYKDYCVVQVSAVTLQNGATFETGADLGGLSVNLNSLDSYLTLVDETMSLSYDTDVIGTGTKVRVMQGDAVINEYDAVLYGDVNGDGWYDGNDAYYVRLVAQGMVSPDALTEEQRKAADCNHDGLIDLDDVALLEKADRLLSEIDRSATAEELAENSAYQEYCSLITQRVGAVEPSPEEPEKPEQHQKSTAEKFFDFFRSVFAFLSKLFFTRA